MAGIFDNYLMQTDKINHIITITDDLIVLIQYIEQEVDLDLI